MDKNVNVKLITIVFCFIALLVNLLYFIGNINNKILEYKALEFIMLFLINVFGFVSSMIQVFSFINENNKLIANKITSLYRQKFPEPAKSIKERYKHLK